MNKKNLIIISLAPFLFSCYLNDEIYDYFNFCSENLLNYDQTESILQNKDISYPLETFIAEKEEEYETGLMCRRNLPPNIDGMIFKYKQEQNRGFWMYKTYIPLTVIYFDKNGYSIKISHMSPCKREIFESKNDHELRCLEESFDYTPSSEYLSVLEIRSDYKYMDELKSLEEDEKLKLIIKN